MEIEAQGNRPDTVARPAAAVRPAARWWVSQAAGDRLLVAGAVLLVSLISQGVILYSTGGHLAPALDDTFIHLRYATQLAGGQFFAYNTADGYSSGASSFLYVLLLAACAAAGVRGDDLLLAAQAINAVGFMLAAVALYSLGRRLRGRGVGWVAAGLLVLNGRVIWGAASGMEIGLAVGLVSALLLAIHMAMGSGRRARPAKRLTTPLPEIPAPADTPAPGVSSSVILSEAKDPQVKRADPPTPASETAPAADTTPSVILSEAKDLRGKIADPAILRSAQDDKVTRGAQARIRWLAHAAGLGLLALLAVALAWVRLEGLALVGLAAGWAILRALRTRRGVGLAATLSVAAALGTAQIACNWWFTGRLIANTALHKSIYFLHYPASDPLEAASYLFGGFADNLMVSFGGQGYGQVFPPMALLFGALGLLPGVAREWRRRTPGFYTLGALLFFGGLLVTSQLQGSAYDRYRMPIYPIWALFLAVGMYDFARWLAGAAARRVAATTGRRLRGNAIFAGLALLTGLTLAPSAAVYLTRLAENVGDIYHQQMSIAHWLDANLPRTARLAVNDVGAYSFYTDRYIYDLVGLTSNATAGLYNQGDGVIFEWLTHLPAAQRPDYVVMYESWFPNMAQLGGFLPEINRWHLLRQTIAGAPDVSARQVQWAAVGQADGPWLNHDRDLTETAVLSVTVGATLTQPVSADLPVGRLVLSDTELVTLLAAPGGSGPVALDRLTLTSEQSGAYSRLNAADAAILTDTQILQEPWAETDTVDGRWARDGIGLRGSAGEDLPPLVFSTTLPAGSYALTFSGLAGGAYSTTLSLHTPNAELRVPAYTAPVSRTLVDRLNVADVASEGTHGYRAWAAQWNDSVGSQAAGYTYPTQPARPLLDGGRILTGGEEFTVTTTPGQALKLVRRYHSDGPVRLAVEVDGVPLAPWPAPATAGWGEAEYVIPAARIPGPTTHLRLTLLPDEHFTPYTSFYYWFYQ